MADLDPHFTGLASLYEKLGTCKRESGSTGRICESFYAARQSAYLGTTEGTLDWHRVVGGVTSVEARFYSGCRATPEERNHTGREHPVKPRASPALLQP